MHPWSSLVMFGKEVGLAAETPEPDPEGGRDSMGRGLGSLMLK